MFRASTSLTNNFCPLKTALPLSAIGTEPNFGKEREPDTEKVKFIPVF